VCGMSDRDLDREVEANRRAAARELREMLKEEVKGIGNMKEPSDVFRAARDWLKGRGMDEPSVRALSVYALPRTVENALGKKKDGGER